MYIISWRWLVVAILVALPIHSYAEVVWTYDPSVRAGIEYNDNIRLVTTKRDAVWGRSVVPRLDLEAKSRRSLTKLGAALDYTNYTKNEINNRNLQRYTLVSKFQQNPRNRWDIVGNLLRDTVLTPVSPGTGLPGAVPDPDEGADNDARRNRLRLTPYWTRSLTQRDFLIAYYQLYDVTYVGDTGVNTLVDNRSQGVGLTFKRQMTKKTAVSIGGVYSEYEAPDVNSTASNYAVLGKVNHTFSQTFDAMLEIGMRNTETRLAAQQNQSTNPIYRARLVQSLGDVTSYQLLLQRRLLPSGTGGVVESDRADLRLRHRIKQTLTFAIKARYFRNETVGGGGGASRRDRWYYFIQPKLIKALTTNWRIDMSYRYRRQKIKTNNRSADSNAVYANIVYTW